MAYHLERLINGTQESRSLLFGESLREATNAADALLEREGVTMAAIRSAPAGDTTYGSGQIVATFTNTGGWARAE